MRKALYLVLILFFLAGSLFAAFLYLARNSEGVVFLNKIRYEVGEHKGARYCKTCHEHEEIYTQWKNNSRHAVATTAESVRDVMQKLKKHAILNFILGGEYMCYACHGPKSANNGIDCETCHGPALPDTPIMESHEKVFKPNMVALKRDDFCAKCHEIPGWVTPYGDWQKTKLVEQGINCQTCHMTSPEGAHGYHGFDSFIGRMLTLFLTGWEPAWFSVPDFFMLTDASPVHQPGFGPVQVHLFSQNVDAIPGCRSCD
jgi:hypothetical protein